MSWEEVKRFFLVGLTGIGMGVSAEVPLGIIGGQDGGSDPYAAFVYSDGSISAISGLLTNTNILGVSINESGTALVGGNVVGPDGYAAFISPSGMVTPLSLSISGGGISAVAINTDGNGIVGGTTASSLYAALIASDGTVTPLSISGRTIDSVALNGAGVGLIGGEGGGGGIYPYAGYVADDGTVTVVPGISEIGHILSVDINENGTGIIGGYEAVDGYFSTFAAFIPPGGMSFVQLSPTPFAHSSSEIIDAAINLSGNALIGGVDPDGNAYAGSATPDGAVTPLFMSPFAGQINGVALNDVGVGLLGGNNGSNFYAALVQSDLTLQPLFTDLISGSIKSVALNNAGIGLIGGQTGSDNYAALVAPNGTLTLLDGLGAGVINSVDINGTSGILDAATPKSCGPYLSVVYTQLAAATALESRFIEQNRLWTRSRGIQVAQGSITGEDQLVASNDLALAVSFRGSSKKKELAPVTKKNSIWIAPFGDYVHLKKQEDVPSITNEVGGALLGYDRQEENYMIGGSLGYAFNYVDYSQGLGHGKVQEELACIYGAYYTDHFWFDAVVWGGLYQFWNTRHTLSILTSKGMTHGWILSPHVEMGTPWAIDQKGLYTVEPFFMVDWVNSWQRGYTETGDSGFNLQVKSLYGSLLQSEIGLRFYERFAYGWGDFRLEEKVSYVNQAPFHFNNATTSFVSSGSSFPIAVGSSKVENLGSVQLVGSFVPNDKSYPFGGFALQATGNGSYQSYFVSVFSGYDF